MSRGLVLVALVALMLVGVAASPAAAQCPCDCDVDGNGECNVDDILTLLDCAQSLLCSMCVPTEPPQLNGCDVNCDGAVDDSDIDSFDCLADGGGPECCGTGAVPTVSEWGLITMAAVALGVGVVVFRRTQQQAA